MLFFPPADLPQLAFRKIGRMIVEQRRRCHRTCRNFPCHRGTKNGAKLLQQRVPWSELDSRIALRQADLSARGSERKSRGNTERKYQHSRDSAILYETAACLALTAAFADVCFFLNGWHQLLSDPCCSSFRPNVFCGSSQNLLRLKNGSRFFHCFLPQA